MSEARGSKKGERWLGGRGGGGRLRSGVAKEDGQIHLDLIRQSGKQMSAVSEMGEARGEEGWSVNVLGRIYCLLCPIIPIAPPRLPFSSHPCSISAFPTPDLSKSLLPEERTKEKRRQQRRECSPLSGFLSLCHSFEPP